VTWGVAFKHHYNNGYLHWEIGAELGLIFEPCKTIQIDINPLHNSLLVTIGSFLFTDEINMVPLDFCGASSDMGLPDS